MSRRLAFDSIARQHYVYWQTQDKRTLERINVLIRECLRDPFRGIGKPEPLKGELAGLWSRRIDDAQRLVYRVIASDIEIVACRYHYGTR